MTANHAPPVCRLLFLFLLWIYPLGCVRSLEPTAGYPHARRLQPSSDFSSHQLTIPRIYHGREKRQLSTTKESAGLGHAHDLTVAIQLDGAERILDLQLQRQLLPKGFFRRYQKNGSHIVEKPSEEQVELCQYQGTVRDAPDSWVAVSTCHRGFSGVIYDGNETHYIEKASPTLHTGFNDEHFVYKHSNIVQSNKTCGYGDDHLHIHDDSRNRILRYKRNTDSTLIRGPYNANRKSRYVELVLVVDNREYKELGENLPRVSQHCKDIANIINALYSPLNIFIALVGVVVWTEYDEIELQNNGDATLTNFLHYRREKLIKDHPNDNAQLLTRFVFDRGVVGKALKGPICTFEFSGGVSMDHSNVITLVATTVAHEMGHNFGMEHDTNECSCPDERCIMAPSSSSTWPKHWSSCSLDYLALAFEHGMDYCLRNKPVALFDSPVCGNGFVEPGEQCDCGLPDRCDNPCCNATSCMLFSNASCATGECCDLSTCHPKKAGTECRSAHYECDLPEFCTGQSEYCPDDIYKMDTESCDGGKAFCYQGSCRTRTDQCRLLWGNTGKSSDDECYNMNTKGNRNGNCGFNRFNKSFIKCNDENVLCGMLHCRHLNERLEFGMESVAILSQSFINLKGSVIPCRTAIVDLGLNQVDPGLAPDGARCGDGKMCVNQKCIAVDSLKLEESCPNDCNGNGICNSLGHCHCHKGYSPPFCDYPGPGGSEDSGPASDPDARKDFILALYVIFLGIVPTLGLVAFIIYYSKQNPSFNLLKVASVTKSPPKTRGGASFSPQPRSPREDNSSLLQEENAQSFQNELFGHFKGFSLMPIRKMMERDHQENRPSRAAPPVPAPPTVPKSPPKSPPKPAMVHKEPVVTPAPAPAPAPGPALPPLNPGSHPRPLISSPILENSTCTAKELVSPLRKAPAVPVRPAPERPLSTPDAAVEEPKKASGGGTLNRIASFLKKEEKCSTLPRNPRSVKALDKEALKNLEISHPIPQSQIEVAASALPLDSEEGRSLVMRTQSMRDTKAKLRPQIPNFGSMRQPGFKRPTSIPAGSRPKSPPPPRPPPPAPAPDAKKDDQYDDCLNEAPLANIAEELSPTSSDNIYAVIEESPQKASLDSSSSSSENVGLLGEIVSEIQNRNLESIYSTSTLGRKKEEAARADTYVNTAEMYKAPESVYSNMGANKSSASSTASGYISPASINPPVKPVLPAESAQPKAEFSTFKSDPKPLATGYKPYTSPFSRPLGPLASAYKSSPLVLPPTADTASKPSPSPASATAKAPKAALGRQVTPPSLRTRRSSPTRPCPPSPKAKPNSPDVVASCSPPAPGLKSPDVVSNGGLKPATKPVPISAKPQVAVGAKDRRPPLAKALSDAKPPAAPKTALVARPPPAKTAPKHQLSTVASLQQKFEGKAQGAPKTVVNK